MDNIFSAGKQLVNLGMATTMEGPVGVAMVKATNLDVVAPKEKHVRFLIQFTNENLNNEETTSVFKALQTRVEERDCVIVIKALVTLHRLLREGPLSFTDVALARAGLFIVNTDSNCSPSPVFTRGVYGDGSEGRSEK